MRIYNLIHSLLTNYPVLRSSDKKLMWTVWFKQGLAKENLTKKDFVDDCLSPESITRARRKVQEEHPELKGRKEVEYYRRDKETTKGEFVHTEDIKVTR